ncbi:hypothetical protein BGX28_008837 [Mortierella sp. GBA30]|nr:hypothetical protein BGX28_008837 [Mortierella sp. GBA30]
MSKGPSRATLEKLAAPTLTSPDVIALEPLTDAWRPEAPELSPEPESVDLLSHASEVDTEENKPRGTLRLCDRFNDDSSFGTAFFAAASSVSLAAALAVDVEAFLQGAGGGTSRGDVIAVEKDATEEHEDDMVAESKLASTRVPLIEDLIGGGSVVVIDKGPSLTAVKVDAAGCVKLNTGFEVFTATGAVSGDPVAEASKDTLADRRDVEARPGAENCV